MKKFSWKRFFAIPVKKIKRAESMEAVEMAVSWKTCAVGELDPKLAACFIGSNARASLGWPQEIRDIHGAGMTFVCRVDSFNTYRTKESETEVKSLHKAAKDKYFEIEELMKEHSAAIKEFLKNR